jgi:hypothetical protein
MHCGNIMKILAKKEVGTAADPNTANHRDVV